MLIVVRLECLLLGMAWVILIWQCLRLFLSDALRGAMAEQLRPAQLQQ